MNTPDPSTLTTQQILREVSTLKELLQTRMEEMEKATALRLKAWEGEPAKMRDVVGQLRDLHDEKFNTIRLQFQERDTRTEQASASSAQALAAALQAAKELVGAQGEASAAAAVKSETSFTKQIDQIGTIIQTLEKALDSRITELKERIDRGEGTTSGAHDTMRVQREMSSQAIATIVALLILVQVAVGLVVAFKH